MSKWPLRPCCCRPPSPARGVRDEVSMASAAMPLPVGANVGGVQPKYSLNGLRPCRCRYFHDPDSEPALCLNGVCGHVAAGNEQGKRISIALSQWPLRPYLCRDAQVYGFHNELKVSMASAAMPLPMDRYEENNSRTWSQWPLRPCRCRSMPSTLMHPATAVSMASAAVPLPAVPSPQVPAPSCLNGLCGRAAAGLLVTLNASLTSLNGLCGRAAAGVLL